MKPIINKKILAFTLSAIVTTPVLASNGNQPTGIGQSAKAVGGAGIAYPQDTLAMGINPAAGVHLGN